MAFLTNTGDPAAFGYVIPHGDQSLFLVSNYQSNTIADRYLAVNTGSPIARATQDRLHKRLHINSLASN
ncbi:hypothetical protein [Streptococcus equi]|uniref:hypothetical protein n=1 Tax=Streptococcus equi TaxID=1336 RepID=UPI001E2AFBE5|nr:hypothetical protein [Streptococcus equi]MCD3403737.1 hypothetical protein [Streptococcus equi subsp. zooepidemicus]